MRISSMPWLRAIGLDEHFATIIFRAAAQHFGRELDIFDEITRFQ